MSSRKVPQQPQRKADHNVPGQALPKTAVQIFSPQRLLTTSQAAARVGVRTRRMRQLARDGYVGHKVVNGRYYFQPAWIDEYLSSGKSLDQE